MMSRVRTRDVVLAHAAALFAERGYGGTTVADIGAACGISGPALYKHFASKYAVLQRILTDISEQLVDGGESVVRAVPDAATALARLVAFHIDFAFAESAVIRVQDRDLETLNESDRRVVRRLQRRYVEIWVDTLTRVDSAVSEDAARLRVHATFGLMNSTPHMGGLRRAATGRSELIETAMRALVAAVPARETAAAGGEGHPERSGSAPPAVCPRQCLSSGHR